MAVVLKMKLKEVMIMVEEEVFEELPPRGPSHQELSMVKLPLKVKLHLRQCSASRVDC